MRRCLCSLLIAVASVGLVGAQTVTGQERMIGYTQEAWGRSNVYPFFYGFFVRDSIAVTYHGPHGSYFDLRRLQFLPAMDQSVAPYNTQNFFSDIPASNIEMPPLPNRFFFSWNSVEYDTLRVFRRDSMNLPFYTYATLAKQYDSYERLATAQYVPNLNRTLNWANQCKWNYSTSGRLASLQVYTNFPGPGWDTLEPEIFEYNAAGQHTRDTNSSWALSKNLYHYTPLGLIDTITQGYYKNGIWTLTGRDIFTYDPDQNTNSILSYLRQTPSYTGSGLKDTYREQYTYAAGTNKILSRRMSYDAQNTGLQLLDAEVRHYNTAGLPDTIFFSDHANRGYCKVLLYDSSGYPVSITFYDSPNWMSPKYWEKDIQQRFYYEPMPASLAVTPTLAENKLVVYPNPTAGTITINAALDGKVTLCTLQGILVASYALTKGKQILHIPASLAVGIFLLRYYSANGALQQTARIAYQP